MAGKSRNVDVEVSISGEQKYKQAISELNAANKTLGAEMKRLAEEYKGNEESMDFLTQKGEKLQDMLDHQREKIEQLKEAVKLSAQTHGEASTKTQALAAQLANAETSAIQLERAIEENNEAMQDNASEMAIEEEALTGLGDTLDQVASKFGISIPSSAKEALNGMERFSSGTVVALGAAAAGVTAIIEGVKKLYEMTVEYAEKADELVTRSMQTGLSTEFLQAYEYAQNLVDVDLETYISSLRKLTDQMDAARDGNKQLQKTFADLGVQVTNTADGSLRPADEVMLDVIDALHSMENETERNAAASEIFGKSYQSLNPLIVQGTQVLTDYMDAAKDNYNLTENEIKALAGLDDAVQKNKNEWEGLKQHLAAQFAPAATEALENFTELVVNAGKALADSKIIEGVGEIFKFLSAMLQPLSDLLDTADTAEGRLRPVYEVLHGIAGVLAWIADAAQVAIGLVETLTIVGAKDGLTRIGTAMGYGAGSGQYSNLQKWQGYGQVYEGNYYDSSRGVYTGNYFTGNASGNDNWRGGLTWVGENGPELVALPQGSQILSAQESSKLGGDTFYITIDAARVKEFNDIVEIAQSARVRSRMR